MARLQRLTPGAHTREMGLKRIVVSAACPAPCSSCEACGHEQSLPRIEDVLAIADEEIVLGGGDATLWPKLDDLLMALSGTSSPKRVWVEAPARSLTESKIEHLASLGLHGLIMQVEPKSESLMLVRPGGGGIVGTSESLGVRVRARISVGADGFSMVVPIARHLSPRPLSLELSRRSGEKTILLSPAAIDDAFLRAPSLSFADNRFDDRGYLPPCALPKLYRARPDVWAGRVKEECVYPNKTFELCALCPLSTRCSFKDSGALGKKAKSRLVLPDAAHVGRRLGRKSAVPAWIAELRRGEEIPCIAPWMVMEIVDPVGLMNHCCADWTVGSRGNARVRSLDELWNGPNYRAARRRMLGIDEGPLCRPICPRLDDRRFAENELQIIERSPVFVENQLMLAEDLALRREVVRAKPLYMTLCPTTYCNYDCIMCAYGRLPRRDLPAFVIEQVESYLPTLRTLTLLGGEPLASRAVMGLLARFDRDRYPDGGVDLVTNGSLLTRKALENLGGCAFGAVVVSMNAGTPDDYERVHRGLPLSAVLDNLDALIRHRERYGHFGIALSFVVQPAASGGLIDFGKIALERDLDIRLLPLTPSSADLDYYGSKATVEKVLADLEDFSDWIADRRPSWDQEIENASEAIRREARRRQDERAEAGAARVLFQARVAARGESPVESAHD